METEALDAAVKTRVPEAVKTAFEALAKERGLKAADLQREALTEYLDKHKRKPDPQLGLALVDVNGGAHT